MEIVADVGERGEVRMTFEVEFRSESSDVVLDVVVNEASVKLNVNGVVVSVVELNVGWEVHSSKVVSICGRDGNIVVLQEDRSESLRECSEGGRGTNLNRFGAGSGPDSRCGRHVYGAG
jgi:hypothetical protein